MEMIFVFTLLYLLFIFIDIIPLKDNKQYKLLRFYSIAISISFCVTVAFGLGIKLPSPAVYIDNVIKMILGK